MGSNPISPTLDATFVLDSPPLQALHRCGALAHLRSAYARLVLPTAVAAETARSLAVSGVVRVPDLRDLAWLETMAVGDEELQAAGAQVDRPYRSSTRFRFGARQIDRPELEAVVLAARLGALLVIEDKAGVRSARDLRVPVIGTARLLCDLELRGHVDDASARAREILATGYDTADLRFLAGGSRRPAWKVALPADV